MPQRMAQQSIVNSPVISIKTTMNTSLVITHTELHLLSTLFLLRSRVVNLLELDCIVDFSTIRETRLVIRRLPVRQRYLRRHPPGIAPLPRPTPVVRRHHILDQFRIKKAADPRHRPLPKLLMFRR